MMGQIGKLMLVAGLTLMIIGAGLWGLGALGVRRLPGDWVWRSGGMTVIVPLGTCVLISLVLTLGMWLWQWWQR